MNVELAVWHLDISLADKLLVPSVGGGEVLAAIQRKLGRLPWTVILEPDQERKDELSKRFHTPMIHHMGLSEYNGAPVPLTYILCEPLENESEHLNQALALLAPTGRLAAILPAGFETDNEKLRARIKASGAFLSVGEKWLLVVR